MADALPALEMARAAAADVRALTLLYHDVVAADFDESGFAGAAAARYKLRITDFDSHLAAIHAAVTAPAVTAHHLIDGYEGRRFMITADDGGASSVAMADRLEEIGWRGHFFITTDRIGSPGFLSRAQIRDLHARGHVIGSHSHSHPYRISELPDPVLAREWRHSVAILSDILGTATITASVPGGFFAPRVAHAAAACGVRVLFTSEPTTRVTSLGTCLIAGRYTIYRGVTPAAAAALARGDRSALFRQQALWSLKKTIKKVAAPVWDRGRQALFRAAAPVPPRNGA